MFHELKNEIQNSTNQQLMTEFNLNTFNHLTLLSTINKPFNSILNSLFNYSETLHFLMTNVLTIVTQSCEINILRIKMHLSTMKKITQYHNNMTHRQIISLIAFPFGKFLLKVEFLCLVSKFGPHPLKRLCSNKSQLARLRMALLSLY